MIWTGIVDPESPGIPMALTAIAVRLNYTSSHADGVAPSFGAGARAAEHYLVDPYETKGRPAVRHASF